MKHKHKKLKMSNEWRNEDDFLDDLDVLSDFKYRSNEPVPIYKYKKHHNTLWYETESDDEESAGNASSDFGMDTDYQQRLNEVRSQVHNTFGNRNSNEAIESYYNVIRSEEAKKMNLTSSYDYANEVSNRYKDLSDLETNNNGTKKKSVAAKIQNSTKSKECNETFGYNDFPPL